MHIDSTQFGNVVIDGEKYSQVLIIGDSVVERDDVKLQEIYGTSHKIGEWEVQELLKEDPEIIVIGTGQNGAMKIDLKLEGVEIISDITPKAIEIFNKKSKNKKVNALIHTTC